MYRIVAQRFDILIIVLIIGIVATGSIGSTLIIKKRKFFSGVREKEISENKKEKIRHKLEEKLNFIDILIKERKIKLAYKNLVKIKDTADLYDFFTIFNKANEKVEKCKEIEIISTRAIPEEVSKPFEKKEAKEVILVPPITKNEEERKYNIFISYSTVDIDYFQIEKIVEELKKYPNINQISYWERA